MPVRQCHADAYHHAVYILVLSKACRQRAIEPVALGPGTTERRID